MRKRDKDKERREVIQSYTFILQFGINMIVPILACTAGGIYIDKLFGLSMAPVIGFVIGALAGYTSIYKMVQHRFQKKEDDTNN